MRNRTTTAAIFEAAWRLCADQHMQVVKVVGVRCSGYERERAERGESEREREKVTGHSMRESGNISRGESSRRGGEQRSAMMCWRRKERAPDGRACAGWPAREGAWASSVLATQSS